MRKSTVVLTFLLAACGQSDQTVTYRDSEGNERALDVRDRGGERTVTSDDGLITAHGTKNGAKARFPDYAPQYPGATVQSVVDMDVGQSGKMRVKQHMITMQTKDSSGAVIAFYREKIGSAGKSVKEVRSATGPMLMVGGATVLDMEGAVTAMPIASGGTSVSVSVTTKMSPT